jgi:PiT family inorganic phosphate transporter
VQLASAATYSLGHGGNEAQMTMGNVLAVLISAGSLAPDADVPLRLVLACRAAMGL